MTLPQNGGLGTFRSGTPIEFSTRFLSQTATLEIEYLARRVSHVVSLPDSLSSPIVAALETAGVRHLAVTREGEAFAIAAGLWLGGARPLVIIQNTGLLESGDAIRGTVLRMGVPLVFIVTCRGYDSLRDDARDPQTYLRDGALLVDPELDTVALFAEPTLHAWGIPTFDASDASTANEAIETAFDIAEREQRPAALLVTKSWDAEGEDAAC